MRLDQSLEVRAKRILERPVNRCPSDGAEGEIAVQQKVAARVGQVRDGHVTTAKKAGSSRKANEIDVPARFAVKSTV